MTTKVKIKKVKKTPQGTKVTKEFEFNLTKDQFGEYGQNAASLAGEITELELQFEEVKQNWKAKINTREAKRDEILGIIRAKKEKRTVEATMVKDYEGREIQYWFEGSTVESRTMTESELQMEVNFDKAAKRSKATKQSIQKQDPIEAAHTDTSKDEEIAEIHRLETGRRSKNSSVDGPLGA